MSTENIKRKGRSFGACTFSRMAPKSVRPDTKIVNITISFEEALKLNVAIDECVRRLNGYNRANKRGRNAALALVINLDGARVRVHEGKLGSA